jgi:integrase
VAAAVADWLGHLPRQIKDPSTVALVRRHGERITAEPGRIPLKRLQARDVEKLLGKMAADGLSTSTIRGCLSVLARSQDRAIRDRLITVNVARVAEVPEGSRRQSRSMTTAQARQLQASDLSVWWRAYFTLALYCGLRPGELTGLRWEVVDTDAGLIRVRRSVKRGADGLAPGDLKTENSKRTLAMPDAVREALTAIRRQEAADRLRLGPYYQDKHDLVFRDDAGRRMARQRVHKHFRTCSRRPGSAATAAEGDPAHVRLDRLRQRREHRGHRGRGRARQRQRDQGRVPPPDLRYRDQGTRRDRPGTGCGGRSMTRRHPVRHPRRCSTSMTRYDATTTTCASRMSSLTPPMTSRPGASARWICTSRPSPT